MTDEQLGIVVSSTDVYLLSNIALLRTYDSVPSLDMALLSGVRAMSLYQIVDSLGKKIRQRRECNWTLRQEFVVRGESDENVPYHDLS